MPAQPKELQLPKAPQLPAQLQGQQQPRAAQLPPQPNAPQLPAELNDPHQAKALQLPAQPVEPQVPGSSSGQSDAAEPAGVDEKQLYDTYDLDSEDCSCFCMVFHVRSLPGRSFRPMRYICASSGYAR